MVANRKVHFGTPGQGYVNVSGQYFGIESDASVLKGAQFDWKHMLIEAPSELSNCFIDSTCQTTVMSC